MGNQQNSAYSIADSYNPSLNGWQIIQNTADYNIWRNSNTLQKIQEYTFILNDNTDYKRQKEVYQFRYMSSTLIASWFFQQDKQSEMCSTYFKGKIYLQKISFRINKIKDIPFPDILHVFYQIFRGFKQLYLKFGYFYIQEDLIGINQVAVVKVWMNSNFAKADLPILYSDEINIQKSQKSMIHRILDIIKPKINYQTLPENIIIYYQKANPLSLQQAENLLIEFSRKYLVSIPIQLDSALNITNNLNQIQENQTYNNNNYNYEYNNRQNINNQAIPPILNFQKVNNTNTISDVIRYNTDRNNKQVTKRLQSEEKKILTNFNNPILYNPNFKELNRNNQISYAENQSNKGNQLIQPLYQTNLKFHGDKNINLHNFNIPLNNIDIEKKIINKSLNHKEYHTDRTPVQYNRYPIGYSTNINLDKNNSVNNNKPIIKFNFISSNQIVGNINNQNIKQIPQSIDLQKIQNYGSKRNLMKQEIKHELSQKKIISRTFNESNYYQYSNKKLNTRQNYRSPINNIINYSNNVYQNPSQYRRLYNINTNNLQEKSSVSPLPTSYIKQKQQILIKKTQNTINMQ